MSRDDPQFKLRLPPDLRERLGEAADSNLRSINSEIVARLEWTFRVSDVASADGVTPLQRALHAADRAAEAIGAIRTELQQMERDEAD